ncbi:TPA: plasmid partitioning protein RepB C-terminal domain-containing protein [Acinetobacter baumannii]
MTQVSIGFNIEPLTIQSNMLLALKRIQPNVLSSHKFLQIKSSIQEIGLIEPLSVSPSDTAGMYILLDGHLRLAALTELGHTNLPCLVATDDEGYTYNTKINRLSPVQEHHMIKRAIERGVSPERLAKTLNLDVNSINRRLLMLDGICPEVQELLKSRQFSPKVFDILKKMKAIRQQECVELMISSNVLTSKYAEAILATTPESQLVKHKGRSKRIHKLNADQIAKMEREMGNIQGQYKIAEENYAQNTLDFALAKGYLSKLLSNAAVERYLRINQPDILVELESIVQTNSLEV